MVIIQTWDTYYWATFQTSVEISADSVLLKAALTTKTIPISSAKADFIEGNQWPSYLYTEAEAKKIKMFLAELSIGKQDTVYSIK